MRFFKRKAAKPLSEAPEIQLLQADVAELMARLAWLERHAVTKQFGRGWR
jgi:hypothetical protein